MRAGGGVQLRRAGLRLRLEGVWAQGVLNVGRALPMPGEPVLVDPEGRPGAARLDAQYWRANTGGSERYVLSLAGSIKYRLRANESGFRNLFLTGDWIDNHFNTGCIEATAMAGLVATGGVALYLGVLGE